MIKPGLYRHYKGKLYRVLFTATWRSALPPIDNGDVLVGCEVDGFPEAFVGEAHSDSAFLTAKWSGNNTSIEHLDSVVIYVALYDDGRVAARSLNEFDETIKCTCKLLTSLDSAPPLYTHQEGCPCGPTSYAKPTKARFERIGE